MPNQQVKEKEQEMGVNRFKLMVGQEFKGVVDTEEWDLYAKWGPARSFEAYLEFSGVTFKPGKKDQHSCKQLHWVPYSDPSSIEALLPGWKLVLFLSYIYIYGYTYRYIQDGLLYMNVFEIPRIITHM